MQRKVSALEVVGAGVVAAVVIACGEEGLERGGELMKDAGTWMMEAGISVADAGPPARGSRGQDAQVGERDAGPLADAGRTMMQMGGDMLAGAGAVLRDAGAQLDGAQDGGPLDDGAVAQNACGSCTAGQRQMVVTADQDPQQLRGTTLEGAGWATARSAPVPPGPTNGCTVAAEVRQLTAKLADGPLMLTDVYYSSSAAGQLYTVPVGSPCHEPGPSVAMPINCGTPSVVSAPLPSRPASSRTLFSIPDGFVLTGARVAINANETLCAIAGPPTAARASDDIAPTSTRLLWSGFAPYE